MLSWVEHEKSFITPGTGSTQETSQQDLFVNWDVKPQLRQTELLVETKFFL